MLTSDLEAIVTRGAWVIGSYIVVNVNVNIMKTVDSLKYLRLLLLLLFYFIFFFIIKMTRSSECK